MTLAMTISNVSLSQSNVLADDDLGTLEYWYSGSEKISHWNKARKIFVYNYSSNDNFDLDSYVGFAAYQWSSQAGIGCPVNGTETSYNIIVYGGTEAQLVDAGVFADCSKINGKCANTKKYEGTYTYNGEEKKGYYSTAGKIAIVEKSNPRTDTAYGKTTAHELGHALGYLGHSTTRGDIMYTTSTANTTNALTEQDVNHLSQVF